MFRPAYCTLYFLCSQEREREKLIPFFFYFHCNKKAPNKIQSITLRLCSPPVVSSYDGQQREPEQISHLSLNAMRTWALYQQRPLVPVHLLRKFWRIWVSLSWFLNLLTIDWLTILSGIWWCLIGAHPTTTSRSWKNTGRAQLKDMGSCPIEKHPTVWTSWLGR